MVSGALRGTAHAGSCNPRPAPGSCRPMVNKSRETTRDALARGSRTAGRWAWRHFRLLAGIALVVGMTLTLAAHREALASVSWTIEPLALVASIALLAVAPLAQALTLRIAL